MYENSRKPPIPLPAFRRRLFRHVGFVFVLLSVSMFAGMWGYEHFEHLEWRDAFLESEHGRTGRLEAPLPLQLGPGTFERRRSSLVAHDRPHLRREAGTGQQHDERDESNHG